MKLSDIKEMAYRGGNLTAQADRFYSSAEQHLRSGIHVGDIDDYQVKKKDLYYSLWTDEEMIAALKLDVIPNTYAVVDDLWVKENFRGKKILSKLLWFLKSRENHRKILLAKVHSDDTYNLLKSGGLSKFNRYWYDPMTGATEVFEPSTVDDFYKSAKKKWSLMLEHDGDDDFINMPRFNSIESGFVSQSYDWQIE